MKLTTQLFKFQFSHFEEDGGGTACAMIHRMSPTKTYKQLYIQFLWQLSLFLLTLNVSASIYQTIEGGNNVAGEPGIPEDVLKNFSARYNISPEVVDKLFADVKGIRDGGGRKESLLYVEAFMLALSTFFTIGWDHITPETHGGKAFCAISSIIGIPLTMLVISTAAKLVIRHVQDFIRVSQTNYTEKRNKYGDTKITTRTRALLLPSLFLILVAYWLLTSYAISKIRNFDFVEALYYTFCTFTTIGFGEYAEDDALLQRGTTGKAVGWTLFCFLWVFGGIVLVAANVITIYLYQKKPMRLRKKQKQQEFTAKILDK